jgi:hypothetical protein
LEFAEGGRRFRSPAIVTSIIIWSQPPVGSPFDRSSAIGAIMPARPVTARLITVRTAAGATGGLLRRLGFSTGSRGHGTTLGRRDFLAALPTGVWMASPSALAGARAIIRSGAIGSIKYCRAAGPHWVAAARQVCGESDLIVEVDMTTSGAILLGSAATLVLERNRWQVVP